MNKRVETAGKAGIGIVEIDGQEGRFVCMDLNTTQIILGPEDALKMSRILAKNAYEAMGYKACPWCREKKEPKDLCENGECKKCRQATRELRKHFKPPPFERGYKNMREEFCDVMGYPRGSPGAPEFDPADG